MTEERWLPIPGYEGLYEASDMGRIRRLRERRGGTDRPYADGPRIVRPHKSGKRGVHRYFTVALYQDGRMLRRNVHNLVLIAFVGPPPPGMEGSHDDGDKDNNRLTNLLYKTHVDNCADKLRHGTQHFGERHAAAKLTTAQVVEIRASDQGLRPLARLYGVSHKAISLIKTGKSRKHG